MTCQSCKHWELKKSKMAKEGFATCVWQKPWESFSASHTCQKLEVMEPALIAAREAWFKKVDSKGVTPLKEANK